jgi:hypothetical protein
MKVWYDSEFLERGPEYPIELISIAFVAEDGRELYLVNTDAPWDAIHVHPWLEANVVPYLEHDQALWADRASMKEEINDFLLGHPRYKYDWPELYAWYSGYDHVVFAQIFGTMLNLTPGIPMYTHDVRSMADWFGVKSWPKQVGNNHCALDDARHLRKIYDHVLEVGALKLQPNSGKN